VTDISDKLTTEIIENLQPFKNRDRKIFDGAGLYLHVLRGGAKRWRFKYQLDKKDYLLSLGTYPSVSLEQARFFRKEMRDKLLKGINPALERKNNRQRVKDMILDDLDQRLKSGIYHLEIYQMMLKKMRHDTSKIDAILREINALPRL
jgi:hypothetical protein